MSGPWAHVAMTALTLALLGGVVLWHDQPNGDTPPRAGATNGVQRTTAGGTAPMGGPVASYAEQGASARPAGRGDSTCTVMLVSSLEQAAMVENAHVAYAYLTGDPGTLLGSVLVAGTAEEEALDGRIIKQMALLDCQGTVRVLDLRGS